MHGLQRAGVVLALVALAACESSGNGSVFPARTPAASPSRTDTRIVGLVGSLSGPDRWRGNDAFEGADVAVQALNRGLDEDERHFDLVSLDDRGDEARAAELVRSLAGSDRTVGVVYAGPPTALPRVEGALAQAGIPAVLCYGDLYGARLLSPHVFQASPSYVWEARRISSYLLRDRRYETVGALVRDGLSGRVAARTLRDALRERGRRIGRIVSYPPGEEDLVPYLRRMKRARAEAVVVEASPVTARQVLAAVDRMGASYRSTAAARIASARSRRLARLHRRRWRPHLVGFDLFLVPGPTRAELSPGVVASDTYARGAHYLPVPSFRGFAAAFRDWWDVPPLGWERRAYEAVRMIGWASSRADPDEDLARVLERMRGARFGGLDITFGPDDHTSVDQSTIGLWVVPDPGVDVREADDVPDELPWVPLARGFSIDGERTDMLPEDWRHLFRGSPPEDGPAPRIARSVFGVTTSRRDPVH